MTTKRDEETPSSGFSDKEAEAARATLDEAVGAFEGATLRDGFAALAMMQMDMRGMPGEAVALRCYEIADHMLLQRLK